MNSTNLNSFSDDLEIESLEEWAGHYSGVAMLGVLSVLLAAGKTANRQISRIYFLRKFVIPPAVVAGLMGCLLFHSIAELINLKSKKAIEESMGVVVVNLINLCFAGLVLGFGASKTYVPKTRAIFLGIWHEALPMLLYAQILLWGQSCIALLVGSFFIKNSHVSPYLGALICLGMETGRDVKAYSSPIAATVVQAHDIVRKADTVGLIVSMAASIAVMTWHSMEQSSRKPKTRTAKRKEGASSLGGFQHHNEHFNRDTSASGGHNRGIEIEMLQRQSIEHGSEIDEISHNISSSGAIGHRRRSSDSSMLMMLNDNKKKISKSSIIEDADDTRAGLGAHISIMAAAVLIAWLIDLVVRSGEERVGWLAKHHVMSGFRLFKLSMCTALGLICILRRATPLQFRSEWFFRLSGLCLDLMAIAALGTMSPQPLPPGNAYAFYAIVLACCSWNAIAFLLLAPRMFPNHWVSRGGALTADTLGHSWVGLITVRAIDPGLRTPVPLAYAYKTMLFFVPDSGGKNALVVGAIDELGLVGAILLCALILAVWVWLFVYKVMPKMPQFQTQERRRKRRQEHERDYKDSGVNVGEVDSDSENARLTGSTSLNDFGEKVVNQRSAFIAAENLAISSNDNKDLENVPLPCEIPDPSLSEPSDILSAEQIRRLAAVLPPGDRVRNWHLVYSTVKDGASCATLLYRSSRFTHSSTLIVVEDTWGYIFGGFIETPLHESSSYYEAGRSFVFSFHSDGFKRWTWTGSNPYVMLSNHTCIAMGGGDGGFAFRLDDELDQGVSYYSKTFDSPRLSSSEFFRVLSVECWTFKTL